MTRHFSKWAKKQKLSEKTLATALKEVEHGIFEADLGGHIIKKRIAFTGKGKKGGGRTIICFKKEEVAVFIHGFAKNECADISDKELKAFKSLAEILLSLTEKEIDTAIQNDNFRELK